MTRLAFALAALMAACGGSTPSIPWDSDVPEGGRVVYHVDVGLGVCVGLSGCPTRIIDVGGTCITETWRARWEFRESKPCAAPEIAP
jgi:hypothetical protein